MSRRTHRISQLLRAELSELLRAQLRDPRVRLASIADVDVSADLGHARIAVSALGEESERLGAVRALQHAAPFLRRQLATRLRLRAVPNLSFHLDRGAEYTQRITDLMETLHDDEPSS